MRLVRALLLPGIFVYVSHVDLLQVRALRRSETEVSEGSALRSGTAAVVSDDERAATGWTQKLTNLFSTAKSRKAKAAQKANDEDDKLFKLKTEYLDILYKLLLDERAKKSQTIASFVGSEEFNLMLRAIRQADESLRETKHKIVPSEYFISKFTPDDMNTVLKPNGKRSEMGEELKIAIWSHLNSNNLRKNEKSKTRLRISSIM
uniref:Uncharacterized protein n=1 Tax=Peronospora matthiolae TaxID=2874970 RepID=A0AAV1U1D6_9STRA